ncbi:MAG: phospholipase A [Candidatus Levyibacteriota bacterium]
MRLNPLCSFVVSTCVLAAPAACAGDIAACTSIVDDHARLACYDAAARPAPAQPSAQGEAAPPAGRIAPPQAATDEGADRSMIGERWSRYDARGPYPFLVRLHNVNYVVLRHSDSVNDAPVSPTHPDAGPGADLERDELKFQVSFKARLWESADLGVATWLGYTQQSNWQMFNASQSRPFRETDYQPELMFVTQPDMPLFGDLRWQLLNVGFVHQSNGRSDPTSRSWNRIYAQVGLEDDHFAGGKLALLVRPWLRVHESASKDDNPDITDYLGYGDVTLLWRHGSQTLTLTGRGNPATGKGAAQLEWSTPAVGPFRFYLQVFTGYGESLIDYNFRQTVFGAGFALNDLL